MSTVAEERTEVRAVAKWVRVSPRKARLVVDNIRGRTVPEARTVLAFTDRAAAREVDKVLRSAVANAETNHGLVGDELVVSGAFVDHGLIIKRWRAQARGRAHPIKKRTCHITIKLATPDRAPLPEPVAQPVPVSEPEPEQPEAAEEAAQRPVRESGPGEGASGEPGGSPADEVVSEGDTAEPEATPEQEEEEK
jgi:large subunit ribosomal protein L22